MSGFRWISLFLLLLLLLTAVTGQTFLYITVRDGEKFTLPCENVIKDQDKCNSTTWLLVGSGNTAAVELIVEGQIGEKAKSKSDRLSVTANCSLVIKKVTVEDVGRYSCKQFKSGRQRDHTQVDLSVVTMTEHKDNNEVTLNCSVLTYDECRHTVKWLYKGKNLDTNTRTMQASQSTCSATLSLLTSHFIYTSNYKFLKCEVTDLNNVKVQLCNISPQLSGEKPGEEGKTATTQPTTMTTNENITESRKKTGVAAATTEPETTTSTTQEDCSALSYIMLVMRVAELLLITVITVLLFRARGNQRPPDDNIVLYSARSQTAKRSGPAASQECNDEDGSTVNYENLGETSTYVKFH